MILFRFLKRILVAPIILICFALVVLIWLFVGEDGMDLIRKTWINLVIENSITWAER